MSEHRSSKQIVVDGINVEIALSIADRIDGSYSAGTMTASEKALVVLARAHRIADEPIVTSSVASDNSSKQKRDALFEEYTRSVPRVSYEEWLELEVLHRRKSVEPSALPSDRIDLLRKCEAMLDELTDDQGCTHEQAIVLAKLGEWIGQVGATPPPSAVHDIHELLEIARDIASMDCFHTGNGWCEPECPCLAARAGRAVHRQPSTKDAAPPMHEGTLQAPGRCDSGECWCHGGIDARAHETSASRDWYSQAITARETTIGGQPHHVCVDNKWHLGSLASCSRHGESEKGDL